MTDNETIKALEAALRVADETINRQKAEIERLTKVFYELKKEAEMVYKQRDALICQVNHLKKYDEERDIRLHARLTKDARDTAFQEMANQLKSKAHNYYPSIDSYCVSRKVVLVSDIDEILKEKVGGDHGK